MRLLAISLATSLLAGGCATSTYKISGAELERLAQLPPEQRGQSVRVTQQLTDTDPGAPQPVTEGTNIVFMPNITVVDERPVRPVAWGRGVGGPGGHVVTPGGVKGGGGGFHGGDLKGADGKGAAIAALIIAAVAIVAVGGIEAYRYEGDVRLHPMHPLWLYGLDGSQAEMPLAWLDPQSAAFSRYAIVRSNEGPWTPLGRAPLDRQGWTYALFFGGGSFTSADGSRAWGPGSTIQLGYYLTQQLGIVYSMYFGWRNNALGETLFDSRYTLELQGYPIAMGPVHLGLYGGGGGAYRWEDGYANGDTGGLAAIGGVLGQLDINTRIALTARAGVTYVHGEPSTDVLFGLSVY